MKKKLSLAEKIAHLAKLSGVSQAAIAEMVEVHPSHVNHYFRGKSDVQAAFFVEILKTLNIDIEAIVNKEIARMNDLDLEEKKSAGEAFERLMKMMDKPVRKAAVEHLIKYSQTALGAKAKPHTEALKETL